MHLNSVFDTNIMRNFLFAAMLLANTGFLSAQKDLAGPLVLLRPTGRTVQNLPEMQVEPDTSARYRGFIHLARTTFIRDFLDLYFAAQYYLVNTGSRKVIEPAYIAITDQEGGFARKGFVLLQNGRQSEHPASLYVDLVEGAVQGPQNKLMSLTQLYPHEMAHVIYRLLCSRDTLERTPKHVDVHYFSIVTDYGTAFDEGFAEHIENVSRFFEPDRTVREGIFSDINRLRERLPADFARFERDMQFPLRLGFYRSTMLMWYQRYENFKRFEHAVNRTARFRSTAPPLEDLEDRLTFRNAGIRTDSPAVRNLPQQFACEGVVNSFFTHLTRSALGEHYLPDSFYRAFLPDTMAMPVSVRDIFPPWKNQLLKYFYVLHRFVGREISPDAQMKAFTDGYLQTFPLEKETVLHIFTSVTGRDYPAALPPELWLQVDGQEHRVLVLDAWGALTVPQYTFNLNAAEEADLLTIPGMSAEDASRILAYRNAHGGFQRLEDLRNIPGLTPATLERLLQCRMPPETAGGPEEPELSISGFIGAVLKKFLSGVLLCTFLSGGAVWLLFRRRDPFQWKKALWFLLRYGFYGLFLSLAALFAAMAFRQPAVVFAGFLAVTSVVALLLLFRKRQALQEVLVFTALMGGIILLSLA